MGTEVMWLKGKYMPTKGSLKGLLKDKLETLDLPFGTFDSWLILWPIVVFEGEPWPLYRMRPSAQREHQHFTVDGDSDGLMGRVVTVCGRF
jgi:hypothetical protein